MTQEEFEAMLKHAAGEGRHGDTELVHVNKDEERMLKEAGGAGTKNPKTGLKEFYQPEGGAGKAKDTASGSRKSGIDKDRPGKSTGSKGESRGGAQSGKKVGPQTPKSIGNATVADFAVTNKQKAISDFQGQDDSFLDQVGNFIAGIFGAREINPTDAPLKDFLATDKAQWGIDPVQAGLTAGGLFNPIASIASKLYGAGVTTGLIDPTMVGLGYDRFGAYDTLAGGASASTSSNKGGTGGRGEKSSGNLSTDKSSTPGKSVAPIAATPETPTEAKSPADILLDKYKLPGINAPFALSPYTIDRTRHEQLVTQAMQDRGGQ